MWMMTLWLGPRKAPLSNSKILLQILPCDSEESGVGDLACSASDDDSLGSISEGGHRSGGDSGEGSSLKLLEYLR